MVRPDLMILAAAEGGGQQAAGGTGIQPVLDAANSLVDFAGNLFTTIVGNPVLVVFVAAGFVGIGLSIVRRLKSTARG